MRWLIVSLLAAALLLSAFALHRARKAESASRPQARPIVAQVR